MDVHHRATASLTRPMYVSMSFTSPRPRSSPASSIRSPPCIEPDALVPRKASSVMAAGPMGSHIFVLDALSLPEASASQISRTLIPGNCTKSSSTPSAATFSDKASCHSTTLRICALLKPESEVATESIMTAIQWSISRTATSNTATPSAGKQGAIKSKMSVSSSVMMAASSSSSSSFSPCTSNTFETTGWNRSAIACRISSTQRLRQSFGS
mmetsp:Transcript_8241/g.27391  ORF Transcript_8241/g.27391 Transcript_8241/m.27391 type:complete len:212 (+) Transcript_8241:4221-4856(+)